MTPHGRSYLVAGVGGRDGSHRQGWRRAQGLDRRCAVVNAGAGQMRKDSVGERVEEGGEQIGHYYSIAMFLFNNAYYET